MLLPFFQMFPEHGYNTTAKDLKSGIVTLQMHPALKFNPDQWDKVPTTDQNWRFQLHSLVFLLPLLNSDLQRDREEALRWLSSWIRDQRARQSDYGEFAWYPHGVAYRTLVFTNTFVRNIGSELLQNELKSEIERHLDFLRDPQHITYSNHGLIHAVAVIEAAVALSQSASLYANNDITKSLEILQGVLETNVSAAGVHHDHSAEYQFYSLELWLQIVQYLEMGYPNQKSCAEFVDRIKDKLPAMVNVANFLCGHGDIIPPIGDSEVRPTSECLAGFPGPLPDPRREYRSETPVFVDEESGFAIFKDPQSEPYHRYMVFNTQKTMPVAHAHNDALAVFFQLNGVDVFVDSGKYSYNKDDPMRRYVTSWFAHNSAGKTNHAVQNLVLARKFTASFGRDVRFSAEIDSDSAGFDWTREVALPATGKTSIKIVDVISGSEGFMLRWHLGDALVMPDIEKDDPRSSLTLQDSKGRFSIEIDSDQILNATIVVGRDKPFPLGWRSLRWGKIQPCNVLVLRPEKPGALTEWKIETTVMVVNEN
jgi:hypothetical protein